MVTKKIATRDYLRAFITRANKCCNNYRSYLNSNVNLEVIR